MFQDSRLFGVGGNFGLEGILRQQHVQQLNRQTVFDDYSFQEAGGAIIDNQGNTHVHNSDNPRHHIKEAEYMQGRFDEHLDSKVGRDYADFMDRRHRTELKNVGKGTYDMPPGVAAAVRIIGDEYVIISNSSEGGGLKQTTEEMATMYSEMLGREYTPDMMETYLMLHEQAHTHGYFTEEGAEYTVKEFCLEQAANAETDQKKQEWEDLAHLAEVSEQYEADQGN